MPPYMSLASNTRLKTFYALGPERNNGRSPLSC